MKLALIDIEKDQVYLAVYSYVISKSVIFSEKLVKTQFQVDDISFLVKFINHLNVNNLLLYSQDFDPNGKELLNIMAGVNESSDLNVNSLDISLSTRRKDIDLSASVLVSYLLQD